MDFLSSKNYLLSNFKLFIKILFIDYANIKYNDNVNVKNNLIYIVY